MKDELIIKKRRGCSRSGLPMTITKLRYDTRISKERQKQKSEVKKLSNKNL